MEPIDDESKCLIQDMKAAKLKGEFFESLQTYFDGHGYLTGRQKDRLGSAIDHHVRSEKLVDEVDLMETENPFLLSIGSQFRTKGFITDRQYDALSRAVERELNGSE